MVHSATAAKGMKGRGKGLITLAYAAHTAAKMPSPPPAPLPPPPSKREAGEWQSIPKQFVPNCPDGSGRPLWHIVATIIKRIII